MKFREIKAILFDIDGTLLDTTEMIFRSYEHTIKKHKLANKSRKDIASNFGKELIDCYEILYPTENARQLAETHMLFQEENIDLSKPYKGVKTILPQLKKTYKIAAITTRSKRTSLKSLKKDGIFDHINVVISREDVDHPKPHKEPVIKACLMLGVKPSEAVMVGDTPIDIQTGKNAKCMTIGVTYGPLGENVLVTNPDESIASFSEIIKYLER